MRDLESKNPPFAKAEYFVALTTLIPLAMSTIGIALAGGAADELPLLRNPVSIFCLIVMAASVSMLGVPKLLKWHWRTEHFGVGAICLGAILLLGGVPWLCLLLFSGLPIYARTGLFSCYIITLFWWASPFIRYYQVAYRQHNLRNQIYQMEGNYCYFLAQGDKLLFEKQKLAAHFPPAWGLILPILVAFCTVPAAKSIESVLGLPIVHVFLGIMSIPLDMMAVTFLVRGFLIYFYFPRKIYKETGARVYIDMDTKPSKKRKLV